MTQIRVRSATTGSAPAVRHNSRTPPFTASMCSVMETELSQTT